MISKIIKYASSLVPGITDKFNDIDEAMRLGFNWSKGPFEMLKEIGVKNFFERIDAIENNKWIPKDVKNRLVKQLSQELVPKKVVDRLRKRMGG